MSRSPPADVQKIIDKWLQYFERTGLIETARRALQKARTHAERTMIATQCVADVADKLRAENMAPLTMYMTPPILAALGLPPDTFHKPRLDA